LLELWRARVIDRRVRLIATSLGCDIEHARLFGELALGALIGRYLSRGNLRGRSSTNDRRHALALG